MVRKRQDETNGGNNIDVLKGKFEMERFFKEDLKLDNFLSSGNSISCLRL